MKSINDCYTLLNGIQIPCMGFGTYNAKGGDNLAINKTAIEAGYRYFDTASLYETERVLGQAVKESGIPREEFFIVSKLWHDERGYQEAKDALERTLDRLQMDYLDLYLIHQPVGDYIGAWRAIEEAYREGRLRAIGVSNFNAARLLDFCESVTVKPAVDQVEIHPFFHQKEAMTVMADYGVTPEAWGPFAEGQFGLFTNPVLTEIGRTHGKTAAQVALRWNVQRGVVVIPKTVHKERMEQNFNIWDFALSSEEMEKIEALDTGRSGIVDHNSPAFIRMLHNLKIHE